MTRAKLMFRASLAFLLGVASFSCGGGGDNGGGGGGGSTITSVTVTCATGTVEAGVTDQCSATVHGTGSFSSSVTWTVSAGNISNSGMFTPPNGAGPVTITATSTADTTKSGSTTVTVTVPTITSVTVSCATTTVSAGGTDQCSANVQGTGSFSHSVTWTASAGSISSSGLFTAPSTAGDVTITATSAVDLTKSDSTTVTVTATGPTITSVTVTCPETTLPVGLIDPCSATVQGTGNFNSAVTWTTTAGSVSATGLLTLPASAGSATVKATSVADSTKSDSVTVTVTAAQHAAFTYHGITHVSWSANEYNTTAGVTSQDALANSGSSWAGVLVTWYQANATATSISAASYSPTDAAVVAAITELHAKGVKVMLKPHVDALDGSWRGTFLPTSPANMDAWFASYTTFIKHWAQIAHDNNVEMLCIGTEFVQLTGSANSARWTGVINAIKTIYTGPLTYASNATSAGDEFTSVSFWDQLDVIGLDAYFPLTNHSDPTIAQLVAAWSSNRYGENIVADVQNFSGAHPGQPVIFTEIGYRSVAGANTAPWDFSMAGAVDNMEQQDCFEAMYAVWSQHTSVMNGNFWWAWPVPAPGAGDTDYNPRNKPALTVLENWN